MTLPSTLAYGQVRDWGGIVGPSKDGDATPDVRPITGTVTFTPSVPVQLVTASPRSRWLYLEPQRYGYDETGTLRDAAGNDTVTLISPESIGLSRHDWTWVASFNLSGKVTRPPVPFHLPAGATVDLTEVTPVQESMGVAITRGASAYEVAVANGFVGTEPQWLASLGGSGGAASLVDNGDGTFVLSGSSVTDNGDGTYSVA